MTSIENKTKYINSVLKQNINTRRNTKETTSKNRLKLLKKLHNKTKKNNYDDTMLVCKTCKTKFKSFTGGGKCESCLNQGKHFAYISSIHPVESKGECIPAGGIAEHNNKMNSNLSTITKKDACARVFAQTARNIRDAASSSAAAEAADRAGQPAEGGALAEDAAEAAEAKAEARSRRRKKKEK